MNLRAFEIIEAFNIFFSHPKMKQDGKKIYNKLHSTTSSLQGMLVTMVTRDPLAKRWMGPLETKDTKVCGLKQYSLIRA